MLNNISILTTYNVLTFTDIVINLFYALIEILLTIFFLVGIVACALRLFRAKGNKTTLKEFFMFAAVTTIGYVSNGKLSKTIFLTLLFVSLLVKSILIGTVTSTLFSLSLSNKKPFLSSKDLSNKLFIVVKGSSHVQKMRALNARVYEFDGTNEQAAEFYARNIDKYDGYISDYALNYRYSNQYKYIEPNLIVSNYSVRNDILSLAFDHSFPLEKELNIGILKLQDSNSAYSICNTYVGDYAKELFNVVF